MRRLSLLTLLASSAFATEADVLSASPDAPAVEVGWRGSLRAKAGVHLLFATPEGDAAGPLFEAPAFIELHNEPGNRSVVPYELWRARIALGGGYRFRVGDFRIDALGLLEHESDHATSPNVIFDDVAYGFLAFNDVAVSGRMKHLARHPTFAQLTARLHVLTCTVSRDTCGEGLGVRGDRAFELSVEASQELTLDSLSHWALFVSLSGDVMTGSRLILPARRLALRLGGLWRRANDQLSLSLYGLAGTDVGYLRGPDTLQAGFSLAWSFGS